MRTDSQFVNYFQQIYIVNLVERNDRRDEIAEQLELIGLSIDHPNIQLFPAIRPLDAGEFTSIGARGCFSSHLEILRDAKLRGLNRVLILEDDLNFSTDFPGRINEIVGQLKQLSWEIFYGGYTLLSTLENAAEQPVLEIPSTTGVMTTHFIAFQGEVIGQLVTYLELLLSRKGGDPQGGPMHVDGAYSWFRNQKPSFKTFISFPELGYQRSSRTDIHVLRWYDRVYLIRHFLTFLRKLKNKLR